MQPLNKSAWIKPKPKDFIAACMKEGASRKLAKELYNHDRGECWENDRYVVMLKRHENVNLFLDAFVLPEGYVWLSIRRRDRQPIFDWRDMQQIKNQLVGPECEGVQIFPAESRLIDTSNQYHIIAHTNPEARLPFGYIQGRHVTDIDFCNAVQRPFDNDEQVNNKGAHP